MLNNIGGVCLKGVGLLFSFLGLFFIYGCGTESAEDILEEAKKEQKDLNAVEVDFEMKEDSSPFTGEVVFDFENEQSSMEFDEMDSAFYQDQDDFFIEYDDGTVLDSESIADADNEGMGENTNKGMELIGNPLEVYETWDEDIFNKFDVETNDDEQYELSFNGDESDQETIGKEAVETSMDAVSGENSDANVDASDISIDSFSLDMVVDQDTHRLVEVKHALDYEVDGENTSSDGYQQLNFKNHNDVAAIDVPEATETEDWNGPDDSDSSENSLDEEEDENDEELEDVEDDAADYLEALIEATVFQDEEKFVDKVPDTYPEDSKESDAEMQKEFFKETYIQNTLGNLAGTDVSEEDVEELADAFLHALSQTKYEVIEKDALDEDNIVVTLSVEGIDDPAIYKEVEKELGELYEEGEIDDDELDTKNIELLIEKYEDLEDLSSSLDVDVEVTKDTDGSYDVLLQDQFLQGFVN